MTVVAQMLAVAERLRGFVFTNGYHFEGLFWLDLGEAEFGFTHPDAGFVVLGYIFCNGACEVLMHPVSAENMAPALSRITEHQLAEVVADVLLHRGQAATPA